MAAELPSRARVVIVGGGGGSIAYHLGKLGWTNFDPGNAWMRA
jgi:glycine/D-amino acid oxidase-like deaminating enzyme